MPIDDRPQTHRSSGAVHRWRRALALAGSALALTLASGCKLGDLVSPADAPHGLQVQPAAVGDSAFAGQGDVTTVRLLLSPDGANPRGWSATVWKGSAWLRLGARQGTAPDELAVELDPSTLSPGVYTDTVDLVVSGSGRPVQVPIQYTILSAPSGATCTFGTLSEGWSVSGTLGPGCASPSEQGRYARLYHVTAAAGDSIDLLMSATGFSPRLVLYQGTPSPSSVLAQSTGCASAQAGACIAGWVPKQGGTYTVEVSSQQASASGTFDLSVRRISTASTPTSNGPAAPSRLAQLQSDGTTSVATGDTLSSTSVVLEGQLSDSDPAEHVRLQVEVKPVGSAFDGTGVVTGAAVASGSTGSASVTGLTPGVGYHWRARAVDDTGRSSSWVSYGNNAETSPDFVGPPADSAGSGGSGGGSGGGGQTGGPAQPAGLGQFDGNGASVAVGGTVSGLSVVLKAQLADSDPSAQLVLQVEVVPTNLPLVGNVTAQSSPVSPGQVASVSVSGLLPLTAYQWRCRAVDQAGHASPWVAFGGNATGAADFVTPLL